MLTFGAGGRCRYRWLMQAFLSAAARSPLSVPPFRLARFGDERLARLVAGGNERAFAALYERYHQPLYRYCRSIVRDEADAQDALQSTFAGALVALRRGQRSAPVRAWLFRIAHNEAISVVRRRGGAQELSEASGRAVASAADQAGERERFVLLVVDLRELPERLRGALLMRELSGLSHEEIAIALDTSVGAAKQAIFDARRGLLEFAEGRAMACEEIRRKISDGDGRVLRGRRVRAHLRDCQACAAFSAAIPARRAELQALVPVLPAVASAAMLARLIGSGSGHGAGGGAGAVAAGAAGKTVGATFAAKTLVGAAVLATAAAGVTGVTVVLSHPHHQPAAVHERTMRSGPAARAARPATGTRAPGAVRANATHAHKGAVGGPAGRAATGTSATAAARLSGTQHRGVGPLGALPSQAQGTPARNHAGGERGGPSTGVGRHAGGPPVTRPGHLQPSTAGGSHTQGASGSHQLTGGAAGPAPSTTPVSPVPSSPHAQVSSSTHPPAPTR
jgi:RNA polymerase sigma factor (sigma-70 family)